MRTHLGKYYALHKIWKNASHSKISEHTYFGAKIYYLRT